MTTRYWQVSERISFFLWALQVLGCYLHPFDRHHLTQQDPYLSPIPVSVRPTEQQLREVLLRLVCVEVIPIAEQYFHSFKDVGAMGYDLLIERQLIGKSNHDLAFLGLDDELTLQFQRLQDIYFDYTNNRCPAARRTLKEGFSYAFHKEKGHVFKHERTGSVTPSPRLHVEQSPPDLIPFNPIAQAKLNFQPQDGIILVSYYVTPVHLSNLIPRVTIATIEEPTQ